MVFGVLDRGSETTAGVTRPEVTLDFGGGGDAGDGLGGIADSIGISGGTAAGLAEGLLSLKIQRGFAPAVDWADLHLKPPGGAGDLPALGEAGTITVTVGDHSARFTGTVDQIEHHADGSALIGLGNGGRVLAQARMSTAFVDNAADDVISSLCSEAGVETGTLASGGMLARYVVDDRVSLLDHIARLAASAGALARFNDDGELELIDDASAGEEIVLAAGDALIDYHLSERASSGAVRLTGAGASDPLWLRKDIAPMQAEAGTSPPSRDRSVPWVRSAGGVSTLAEARGRAYARAAGPGRLLLAAFPDALPGTVVTLSGTPSDGDWRVLSSVTRYDAQRGFTHEIRMASEAGGAGAIGLGGLL